MQLGLRARDTVLISVGRLDKNKNNGTLIKAVALYQKPSIHLVICGDGEEREYLSNLAKELGIESQILFLGKRSDMKELYAMADIFVMASYREGLSRSIMEAMASGLPCIVSDIRGNRDLVENNINGFVFKPQSIYDFIAAWNKMLSSDVGAIEKNNLVKIREFCLDTVIGSMKKVYDSEINKK